MASRDVDLVIRAKDESSKAVDAITAALNELISGIKETQDGVTRGESALAKFGKAIGDLDKAFRGANSADRLSQSLDRALASTAKMELEANQTAQSVQKLSNELAEASAASAKYRQNVEQAAAAIEKEKAALAAARGQHAQINTELREAGAARGQLETQERRLTAALEAQDTRLARQKARYEELQAAIQSAETPSKRLANALDATGSSIAKTEAQLAGTKTQLAAIKDTLVTAAATETQFAQALAKSEASIAAQTTTLKQLKSEKNGMAQASRAAAQSERELGQALGTASSNLANQQTDLARASEALDRLDKNATEAKQSMTELAQAARGPLLEAYKAQQAAVSRINNAFQANRQSLSALSQLMGQVGVPTREMAEAYDKLNLTSREIATEYQRQQSVLRQLRAELGQTATDTAQLAAQQRLFATAINGGAAALSRAQASAASAGAASQRIITANAQAARSYSQITTATKQTAAATDDLAQANDRASQSYNRQANAGRQSMSYIQRLRGEVLSMISAYGGLYGVINTLGQVVKSYQALEAAQSRLGAVFQGNPQQQAQELDWIRRNADRLGISFGALADEYTKFAAATKNTVIEGEKTREIFQRIAEAGVVNKLSLEDMSGIFRAVIQIASKGKVQLEELSGQLGDRLPGALQIMADGLGVTTEELLAMTKQGEVTSEALIGFAEELNKRYGPQLAQSLMGSQAALGQLQNAAFQAMVAFANAGFMESFVNLVRELTETIRSDDFLEWVDNVSVAVSKLIDGLTFLVDNFQLTAAALSGFLALAVAPAVVSLGTRMLGVARALGVIAPAATAAATGIAATGTAAATAAVRVGLLGRAFTLLFSSTGVGLVLTAVAVGLSLWATEADTATEAMVSHRKIVDDVKNSYEAAGGKVTDWSNRIKETTRTEAEANLERIRRKLQEVREEAGKPVVATGLSNNRSLFDQKIFEDARKLGQQFRQGLIPDLDEYKRKLDALSQATSNSAIKNMITIMLKNAEGTREAHKELKEAELVVKAYTGTTEEAGTALDTLTGKQKENEKQTGTSTKGVAEFNEKLQEFRDLIPQIGANLDNLKLDKAFAGLAQAATNMGQLNQAIKDYNTGVASLQGDDLAKSVAGMTDGLEAAKSILRGLEGFTDVGKLDGNKPGSVNRAGYGSDTITLADESIVKITAGMRVSREDAERDLDRRTKEFLGTVKSQVGGDTLAKFTAAQQGVLTSIAYNYGSLPEKLVAAIKTGTNAEIADVIRSMATDNSSYGPGVNGKRRYAEARVFESGVGGEAEIKAYEKAAQEREKQQKATQDTIAGNNEAIRQQELINAGKERQAEIEKAVAAAKVDNPNIGAAEIAQIEQQIGKQFDLKKAKEEAGKPNEAARKAEDEVNNLLTKQKELRAQLAIHTANGDTAAMTSVKSELDGVNTALTAAIDNAIKMWEAIGGTEAAAKIATLTTAKLEAQNLANAGQQAFLDWERVGELFVSGLTNAFDRFAQAVANGENVAEAARDAFLQFAADFLIEIGKMIIRQALLNMLQGFGRAIGGPIGGALASVGMGHTGGVVGSKRIGSGNGTKQLPMSVFAQAPRFHGGAVLRPGEVPAVLKEGEEVLSENNPRNILNGGAAAGGGGGGSQGGQSGGLRIINAFDSAEVVRQGLASEPGEETLINFVRGNAGTINDILGRK